MAWNGLRREERNFALLNLNKRELSGSRWALEQTTPIVVSHALEIVDVVLIQENQLTLRVEFHLRQKWFADGLILPNGLFKSTDKESDYITADKEILKQMWSPDSFISTSRESNMNIVAAPLSVVNIFQNKTIVFKARMYVNVRCTSNFQWYPLDIQTCDLRIESFKYEDNVVNYEWEKESVYRPVTISSRRLLQYELKHPVMHTTGNAVRGGRGVAFPYILVKLTFERKLGNNIIQIYTPTTLVVVLSWFSFWLGLDATPGRISLLVTCMLTLVTMHSGIKMSIPPVHYITMMDIWLVVCMAFVFTAICEFVIIKYLHWRHQLCVRAKEKLLNDKNRKKLEACINLMLNGLNNSSQKFPNGNTSGGSTMNKDNIQHGMSSHSQKSSQIAHIQFPNVNPAEILRSILVETTPCGESTSDLYSGGGVGSNENLIGVKKGRQFTKRPVWVSIDRLSRGLFPLLFCTFNMIYWPVLLKESGVKHINTDV